MNRWSRAQVLLGTLVTVEVDTDLSWPAAQAALEAAFEQIAHIGRVMSAHDPRSDLGRLSRARPRQVLTLDPHTLRVLRAAIHWHRCSGGAFDPVRAASRLLPKRPGLRAGQSHLNAIECLSDTEVRVSHPVAIDLGGIAKGYAVDQALAMLRSHGITHARVNAGGDLAVMGEIARAITLRHADDHPRHWHVGRISMKQGAVATSVAARGLTELVARSRHRRTPWRSATVRALDGMTADALTKWALQTSLLCPALRSALRAHRATMWRSR